MHFCHSNLEFRFTSCPCCQISNFLLMWCVQGGLCQLARSHDPRVMHLARPYRPWPICENPPAPPPHASSFSSTDQGFCSRVRRAGAKRGASGRGNREVKLASRLECLVQCWVILPGRSLCTVNKDGRVVGLACPKG